MSHLESWLPSRFTLRSSGQSVMAFTLGFTTGEARQRMCTPEVRGGSIRHPLSLGGLELIDELGDHCFGVTHDAVVGEFEDLGIGVFVDGHDCLGV